MRPPDAALLDVQLLLDPGNFQHFQRYLPALFIPEAVASHQVIELVQARDVRDELVSPQYGFSNTLHQA